MIASNSRATRRPPIEVSATSARHSRVQSSYTSTIRNRRPSVNWSATKSRTPALVGRCRRLYRPPRSQGPLAPAALANHQPLLAIQTLNALLVDRMALAPQKHVQPPIAKPPALLGQRFQLLAKFAVMGPVAHAGPVARNHPSQTTTARVSDAA